MCRLVLSGATGGVLSLWMPKLTLGAVRTLLTVRTTLHVSQVDLGLKAQKVVQARSILAERVVNRHERLVYEVVHEHALLDHLFELFVLVDEAFEVVVGDDDALVAHGQLEYGGIVIAYDSLGAKLFSGRVVYLIVALHL